MILSRSIAAEAVVTYIGLRIPAHPAWTIRREADTCLNGWRVGDVCHVDLACQQALSALHLAKICAVLGLQDKVSFYEAEQVRICQPINERYWSERAGWYFDFFQRDGKQAKIKYINAKTAAAFWTLLCGVATNGRKEAVIGHMFNEEKFYTKVPFATLSKDDPNYDSTGGYWLGVFGRRPTSPQSEAYAKRDIGSW